MPVALYILSIIGLLFVGGTLAVLSLGFAFMTPMLYDSVNSVGDAPLVINLLTFSLVSYPLLYLIGMVVTIVQLFRHVPQQQGLLTAAFPLGYALLCVLVVAALMLWSSR